MDAAVPGAGRAATTARSKRAFVPTVLSSDSLARSLRLSIVVITSPPPPPLSSASPASLAEGSERCFTGGALLVAGEEVCLDHIFIFGKYSHCINCFVVRVQSIENSCL